MRVIPEEIDLLGLAVFENAKVFFRKPAHNAAIAVSNDDIHIDDARGDLDGRRWRGSIGDGLSDCDCGNEQNRKYSSCSVDRSKHVAGAPGLKTQLILN